MTRTRFCRILITLAVSFALALGCFAFGGAAEAALPSGDAALGAMRFQAPAEYDSVRRDTVWNAEGTLVSRRLKYFGPERAWTLMIVGTAATDVSEALSRYPEEAVETVEVNGQSVSIVAESDKCLDAFIQCGDDGYVVYYEEKAGDTADRGVLDAFLETVEFSGAWEDGVSNDDSLGSMIYAPLDFPVEEKEIRLEVDRAGNLIEKDILYSIQVFKDGVILKYCGGKTFDEVASEDDKALGQAVEVGGAGAVFVHMDDDTYLRESYYIEREDGLYEIYYCLDPDSDEEQAMLQALLDSIAF